MKARRSITTSVPKSFRLGNCQFVSNQSALGPGDDILSAAAPGGGQKGRVFSNGSVARELKKQRSMSVLPSWPVIGSLSLALVVVSMSLGALFGHVRDLMVHRDPWGLRALAVFAAEVTVLVAVLVLSDFSWVLALAVAGGCGALERVVLRSGPRLSRHESCE
jgi:hypothetical protein